MSLRSLILTLILLTIPYSLLANIYPAHADWPMVAANPQRTSHNMVEVPGNINVEWFHVIDPYIDNKVQVIAAEDKVFVASSKGLYAFNADTGDKVWEYGTELPLGNSPTYFNGTLYAAGFDHKVHAITAATGHVKPGWTYFEAQAGYDTNPLLVKDSFTGNQPVLYIGNRDGIFYALDGNTGALKWQYATGGPIHFSAAYKNGVVFFASNDAYAYALNALNGSLVWKSGPYPGVGFDMYWPVVYTEPLTLKDYVIFSGSYKASRFFNHAPHDDNWEMYNGLTGYCGPTGNEPYTWAPGTLTIRCDAVYNFYNLNPKWNGQPPWARFTFILDRQNGQETTLYPPINPAGHDGGGQGYKHPPVVGGDGVLYTRVGHSAGGNGGASGNIVGWKFGTPYLSIIHSGDYYASDEPSVFTSGGNLIYYGEGSFNHEGFGTHDITNTNHAINRWQWNPRASGSDQKYTSLRLEGKFGGSDGAYSYMDGVLNFSPIPYKNKLFVINGNALLALSAAGGGVNKGLITTPTSLPSANLSVTKEQIKQRLAQEMQKLLAVGHLRPGFHDSGQWSGLLTHYYYDDHYAPGHLGDYFFNPADTLYTLSIALPHLTPAMQAQVKTYLQQEQLSYPVETVAYTGWRNGQPREIFADNPPITDTIAIDYDTNLYISNSTKTSIKYPNPCCSDFINWGNFPPESFYGAWKYAQVFPAEAERIFDVMKPKLPDATQVKWMGPGIPTAAPNADSILLTFPYLLNQYLAGYYGYMELEKLAGNITDISQSTRFAEYQRLLNLRVDNFNEHTPFPDTWEMKNVMNISRNFTFMVPETHDALQARKLSQMQQTLAYYQTLTPYWFVSKYNRSYAETYSQPLYDYPALFQARAYILDQSFEELVKYLDVPAFPRGDLFYIQNLVALLEAPSSSSPTPTPTPFLGFDGDNDVDWFDLNILISHFNQLTSPYSLLGTGLVDIFDVNKLIQLL